MAFQSRPRSNSSEFLVTVISLSLQVVHKVLGKAKGSLQSVVDNGLTGCLILMMFNCYVFNSHKFIWPTEPKKYFKQLIWFSIRF